ncbi:hypothetical protein O1W68_07720 [Rhodococcus sp. H36-A4]|uniref:hypothetical protein n=1 Tax=Rhodococcus sp. H36-A4 TaxID=3004353 RepID=UPI0022B05BE8|nr:hypothetical protein [Rhodococcus sp. H36-A4]MCZ4077823.1 hypothetical protein [Rhodococcus sp. H36-A4]
MPRRTLTVTKITYQKRNSRNKFLNVAELPDRRDMLFLFHGFAKGLDSTRLVDRSAEKYAAISKLEPVGRTLGIQTLSGKFGEEGETRDIDTHRVIQRFVKKNANAVLTHGVLLVPKMGTSALLFIERSGGMGGSSDLVKLFKEDFQTTYPDYTMQLTSLVEKEAWLEHAQLERVSATLHGHSADVTNKTVGKVVGDLQHVLTPPKGEHLPNALWKALRNKNINRGKLLAFPDGHDPDEVVVALSSGSTRKTFVLGREKTPSISYLLSDSNQAPKNSRAVLRFCLDEATSLFKNVGVEWEYSHSAGVWSPADLTHRL